MRNIKFLISLCLLVAIIMSCGLCKMSDSLNSDVEIEYVVTGTAKTVSVTLESKDGTSQFSDVSIPYSYKVKKTGWCYISAQNGGKTGSVKVAIKKNGKVVKESESAGEYVIASVGEYVY